MRLDKAVFERGLARSRNQAARLILAGQVRVNGIIITRVSTEINHQKIEVEPEQYVSRSAYKLIGALDQSNTAVPARVLDAGASTGGFTQVVLERGAHQVYAIDVGHGQLAKELAEDARVYQRQGLNLRDLTLEDIDCAPVSLVVGDVSFISLKLLLEPLLKVLTAEGTALLLVKPQFEVGRSALPAGGVVTDPQARTVAVTTVIDQAQALGWRCDWQAESVLPGTDGNIEFFIRLIHNQAKPYGQ